MINLKAKSAPPRMLTTVDTVMSALPFRLILALVVACLLILGSFRPAASDRRGGDEGSGVGGTGILDLPGTGLGGSGLRPFLGIVTPPGSPLASIEIVRSYPQTTSRMLGATALKDQPLGPGFSRSGEGF